MIPLVGGDGDINGSFTDVTVESPNPECDDVTGYAQDDASGGISALITVENNCKSKVENTQDG